MNLKIVWGAKALAASMMSVTAPIRHHTIHVSIRKLALLPSQARAVLASTDLPVHSAISRCALAVLLDLFALLPKLASATLPSSDLAVKLQHVSLRSPQMTLFAESLTGSRSGS